MAFRAHSRLSGRGNTAWGGSLVVASVGTFTFDKSGHFSTKSNTSTRTESVHATARRNAIHIVASTMLLSANAARRCSTRFVVRWIAECTRRSTT